jgi:hypothetical protein
MQLPLLFYFMMIAAFAVIAAFHVVVTSLLFVFPPLGLLLIAAPTILLYWLALTPLGLAWKAPRPRIAMIAATALIPVVLAIAPGLLSEHDARNLAAHLSAQDFHRPMTSKPRSIELAGDDSSGIWTYMHSVGDKAAWCNDICKRLLMNGEVDWIRMTTLPSQGRSHGTQSVTYRVEHREVCPELPEDYRGAVDKVLRDRLVAGDCLISEPDNHLTPDVVVRLTTSYPEGADTRVPVRGLSWRATVASVKRLQIESRLEKTVQQTETVTRPLPLPFYLGVSADMQCGSKCDGVTLGRATFIIKPIDLVQTLRQTLGYDLAEIPAAKPQAPRQVSEGLLSLPASSASTFSTQQQDVLNDALKNIMKKPAPSDADIDFIRRTISDDRVTNALVAISIQTMSGRNSAWLERLVPIILDRVMVPVDQRTGHYKGALGWSLQNVPADKLRPYRDQMVGIVASQPDWTTTGILVRLAELGSEDAVNLVIQLLDTERSMSSPRQFAAIAACRAGTDAWPRLEPAVLAHLTPGRPNVIDDDEAALLLALVRFREKPRAIDIVRKRGLTNEAIVIERLNKLETNFDPTNCRDRL